MFQLIKLVVIGGGFIYVLSFLFALFYHPDTDGKDDTPVVQVVERVKPLASLPCSDPALLDGEENCFSVKGIELGMNVEDFEQRMLNDGFSLKRSLLTSKYCEVQKTTDEWTLVADIFYTCYNFPYYGDLVALQTFFANDSIVKIYLGEFKEKTDATNALESIPPIIKALTKKYPGTIQTELKPIKNYSQSKFNAVFIDDYGNKMEVISKIDRGSINNIFRSTIVISSFGLESFIESRREQYNNELMRSKIKQRKSKESDL